MKHFTNFVIFYLALNQAVAFQYVYEFGQNFGKVIYQYDGNIPFLKHVTNKDIPVPAGLTVTYVKVTVNSISPPKVDYLSAYNRVSIVYSLTQLSLSSYSILVKGDEL